MTRHVVEVDTAVIERLSRGYFWWQSLELSCQGSDRIQVAEMRASGKHLCHVACEDEVRAQTLRQRMTAEGLPVGAVQVREVRT